MAYQRYGRKARPLHLVTSAESRSSLGRFSRCSSYYTDQQVHLQGASMHRLIKVEYR